MTDDKNSSDHEDDDHGNKINRRFSTYFYLFFLPPPPPPSPPLRYVAVIMYGIEAIWKTVRNLTDAGQQLTRHSSPY